MRTGRTRAAVSLDAEQERAIRVLAHRYQLSLSDTLRHIIDAGLLPFQQEQEERRRVIMSIDGERS